MNALERILVSTREELVRRRRARPLTDVRAAASERATAGDRRDFRAALSKPGLSLIAEHKRRSPSAGTIREELSLPQVVSAYERAGASALSVLTEGPNFGGALEDLRAAREAASLPILRKDFVVDPYQVHEAMAAGADAILLIVAALGEPELAGLHALATDLGLDVLVEVHDEDELEVALALGAPVIGVNNRDLSTLAVDTRRTLRLRPLIPAGTTVVAESGFSRREELDQLLGVGVDAVLIGESLMRSPDIEAACRALTVSRHASTL